MTGTFPYWIARQVRKRPGVLCAIVACLCVVAVVLGMVYHYTFTGAGAITVLLAGAGLVKYMAVEHELERAREQLEARVADRTAALQEQLLERERTLAALTGSEERYRHIMQTITDYMYAVSFVDGHPVRTTHAPACEAVTGYTSAEFAANPFLWLHMVHADDRDRVLGLTPRILETRQSVSIEHRIIRKDGSLRWIRNTTVPKYDEHGMILSYDGLIQDITDRKNAEEAVRESELKFHAVFDSAGIGIAISALDGTLLQCNPALERMLGYEPGFLQGQPSTRISHPGDHALQRAQVRRVLAGGNAAEPGTERRYVRKDGQTMWGRLTATLLRDAHGNPQFGLSMIEDITERKLSEEHRDRLLRQVQEAMANVKTLSGLVPICASCKKIREDRGWMQVEAYLTQKLGTQFSHGICPDCLKQFYPKHADGLSADGSETGVEHDALGNGAGWRSGHG